MSVAVIVPVWNRPQNAALFMASCRFAAGDADLPVYAVCDMVPDAEAWGAGGATVIPVTCRTFPQKANAAVRWFDVLEDAPDWMFFPGDDVRFTVGWLDEALTVAADTGAQVIGTNDLGNPHVIAGERGTHNLINRRYILERGACLDGPGTVYSEAYRHCCDVETVEVAKARGVWAPASRSIVEHLHPSWGKGEMDDTYRVGFGAQVADWKTWKIRERTMPARLAELDKDFLSTG